MNDNKKDDTDELLQTVDTVVTDDDMAAVEDDTAAASQTADVDLTAPMDVDLTVVVVPLNIKFPNGTVVKGELREVSGDARDAYFTEVGQRMKHNKEGNPTGLSSMKGIQVMLLKHAVFNEEGKAYAPTAIGKWPSRVQKMLFDRCRLISGIEKEEGEDEGED